MPSVIIGPGAKRCEGVPNLVASRHLQRGLMVKP